VPAEKAAATPARRPAAARLRPPGRQQHDLTGQDSGALPFIAEMYGLQLDQLAVLAGISQREAAALAARWTGRGLAETAILSPGPRWIWLTRSGLLTCGLRYAPAPPALPRLRHIRAVAAVRLALEAADGYRAGGAHWRSERHLRARLPAKIGTRPHLPDAEVHWPEEPGQPPPWAGECWAIEAELTPKTVSRTAAVMRELLSRTGDYGGPAAEAAVPGATPRHTRAIYVCSAAAAGTVQRARAMLGSQAARIEIRLLPDGAELAGPATGLAAPGRPQ
jgi:hypothetical protein